jgi:decaprenylphospho-beta-D-ribofuranose 2-oxidase
MNINLPNNRFTTLENFGHSLRSQCYVYRPGNAEEIAVIFKFARENGFTINFRGAGRSYNDAALNSGGIVLDLKRMDHILEWDPKTGVIKVEPGACLRQLWQQTLPDGWWPPVVSGTMTTTLGGCLAVNIHGKNNFRMGPIGEHVVEFTALLPTGAEVTCSPTHNGDLFRAMISGLGMLGIFTSITLQMKKIHSGLLDVHAWPVSNLQDHLKGILEAAPEHSYTVGWLDAMAGGKSLGRGQLHTADYLKEGEDPDPQRTLRVDYQTLPDRFFGLVPKSILHYFMVPFGNDPAWGAVSYVKYLMGLREGRYRQSHAAYHFLLDYIPSWELAYGRGGLIQYQSFLPKETAYDAWTEMIKLSLRRGVPSYLGVTKRHRPDHFLLTHALDGFSLAMDFKVNPRKRARLLTLLQDFDRIVVDAGGRFYFAKNSETTAETARRFLGEETLQKFRSMKKRCDPNNVLESDLYRRVFEDTA